MSILPPDPYQMGNTGPDSMAAAFDALRQQIMAAMPVVPAAPTYSTCAYTHSCKALLLPADVAAHTKWHSDMAAEIKRVNPLINLSLL